MENEEIVKHVDLVSSSAPRYSRLAKRRAEAMVLFHDKVVGHAGNIVADNAVAGLVRPSLGSVGHRRLKRPGWSGTRGRDAGSARSRPAAWCAGR